MAHVLTVAGFVLYLALAAIWVILEKRRPTATLAWLLVLVLMPFIGMVLYLLIGRRRARREVRLRVASTARLAPNLPTAAETAAGTSAVDLPAPPAAEAPLVELAQRIGYSPVIPGNRVEFFFDGAAKHDALFTAIREAEVFVHLDYYICQPDATGLELRELLIEKARAGIEVRFLVDGVGSLSLDDGYLDGLAVAGAEVARFHPPRLALLRNRLNYRNHRKIAVIDGCCGFVGGMNIGDEYRRDTPEQPAWRDTHLGIRGPAVRWLERVFAEDWHDATGRVLTEPRFFPALDDHGSDRVQILASGPDIDWSAIHYLYFTAIATARERVRITTPYFVPDEALVLAFRSAALRGVEIELLLPRKNDLPLVSWAGHSYYEELLEAGVRIHEFQPRMLHAKVLTVDGQHSMVGSANMDIRSFRLNYEVGAFVYGAERAAELDRQFAADLETSEPVNLEACRQRPVTHRFVESTARLLSPLL